MEKQLLNGRYQLLEQVGSGGMAAVYRAQDTVLGRVVALKLLHPSYTGDPEFLTKFSQEAQAVANLSHPNIVTVHDIGRDGERYYIVMEYVEGKTLKQLIREAGRPIPIQRALDLTIQVCNGLGYAHRANLVHCDVKPQNILVSRDDRIKVTDFGIARAMTEATSSPKDTVWGTPQYFSPEQAQGLPATPASDVYSLGIILFEMLTGVLPFSAENHTALALKHIHEPPTRLTAINPAIPSQLEEIVLKLLSKDPSARYRTAGQVGRILSTYKEQGIVIAEEPTEATRLEQNTIFHPPTPNKKTNEKTTPAPQMQIKEQSTTFFTPPPTTDWLLISLAVLAIVALFGLIPLWFFVARVWGVI